MYDHHISLSCNPDVHAVVPPYNLDWANKGYGSALAGAEGRGVVGGSGPWQCKEARAAMLYHHHYSFWSPRATPTQRRDEPTPRLHHLGGGEGRRPPRPHLQLCMAFLFSLFLARVVVVVVTEDPFGAVEHDVRVPPQAGARLYSGLMGTWEW